MVPDRVRTLGIDFTVDGLRSFMGQAGLWAPLASIGIMAAHSFVPFPAEDAFLGFVAFGWMTMGQVLSAPMIAGGVLLLALAYGRGARHETA